MGHDLVIRNGTVIDGSGLGSYRADVGVTDGRIAELGRITAKEATEIDAEGLVVTPGFIDCHTHLDAQMFWDPVGASSCWHGVTSAVMGNCGFTIAPGASEQRHLLVRNLERAEDISGEAMDQGIDWSWESFPEYLDVLDALPKGINYAPQVGHSAVRCHVMGERAFSDEASDDDLDRMRDQVREAFGVGAWGFTTSRTMHHQTPDGGPVASRLGTWDEVRALILAAAESGGGMYQYVEDAPEAEHREAHEAERIALAAQTGLTFVIPAMPNARADRITGFLDRAAAQGAKFVGVTHPRGISNWSSFQTTLPFDVLPEWAEIRSLPLDRQKVLLDDPTVRERLVAAALGHDFGAGYGAEARPPDYDRMRVLTAPTPPYPSVAEVAESRGVDPVTAIIELSLENDFEQFFVQPLGLFDPDQVTELLPHPRTVLGFSDSGAHVSQMSDASIQTHMLAHWVRDRQAFGLEEAVRMLTLEPARVWGMHDRGMVREGLVADLNVFDPETIGPRMPRVVDDLPGGSKRIDQRSEGIAATIVNGQVLIRDGEHTGNHPGQVLRRR